jgi:hypothetical protein
MYKRTLDLNSIDFDRIDRIRREREDSHEFPPRVQLTDKEIIDSVVKDLSGTLLGYKETSENSI